MANYSVDIDFVMAKSIEVEADSEEQAIANVNSIINNNPYDYAYGFSHYVGHKVVGANEV